ncbi:MAG: hypothetical protein JXR96_19950 [Deltaproteobacteria bacterium]|nr:hypothetical protein [Deltaproteobacteria bacterium]
MAHRAYVLANLDQGTERDGVVQVIRMMEQIDEVSFAEPVLGAFDLVVLVESDSSVEQVVDKLSAIDKVRELTSLKVDFLPARERMWRNMSGIPSE